jgi:hypothetical protein
VVRVRIIHMAELSDRDRELLDFEAAHPRSGVAKDEAIRRLLDMPPPRYYQLILALVDLPAAVEHNPQLAARVQRRRRVAGSARSGAVFAPRLLHGDHGSE